jgi:hypothetical protein
MIQDSTKKLLRELAGLKDLADSLDGVASIAQAEQEARKRMDAAQAEAQQARVDADKQMTDIRTEINQMLDAQASLLEHHAVEQRQAEERLQQATDEHAALQAAIKTDQARLDATREELARIASRIGA